MKRVSIYFDGYTLCFSVGSKHKDYPTVDDIIVDGINRLRVYFEDGTFMLYCNLPFEYHGETNQ